MDFFIFDNADNTLKIDEYTILLVKEFKDLWNKDRNKCKEDKTGKLRLKAYKELTYIYLVLSYKSPYYQYLEQDKNEAALLDSGLSKEDLQDPVFKAAFNKYKEIQDADRILSLIKTAYNTLYKMQVHLDNIDFEEIVNGSLLNKPKDVLADIASIGKMRTHLKELEVMHKKDLAEANNKIRGEAEPGAFDYA